MGREQLSQPLPAWAASGEVARTIQSMPRSQAVAGNASQAGATTWMTVLGTSPGKRYQQVRLMAHSGLTGSRNYTILAGADPAFLKVIDPGATSVTASTMITLTFSSARWIPAGHMVVVCLTGPASTANLLIGSNAVLSALHTSGSGTKLAGYSADTAVLTGNINQISRWTVHAFRAWSGLV